MQCKTLGCPWMGVERHTGLTCDWHRWRDDGARSRTAESRPMGRSGHETSPPDLGKRLEQAQRPTNTAPVEGEGMSHTCVSHGAARRCNASNVSPNLRVARGGAFRTGIRTLKSWSESQPGSVPLGHHSHPNPNPSPSLLPMPACSARGEFVGVTSSHLLGGQLVASD